VEVKEPGSAEPNGAGIKLDQAISTQEREVERIISIETLE
jgi:hypothetical protein